MPPPQFDDPTRHDFMTAVAEFPGVRQTVAYCTRCTLMVPTGFHWLGPCKPKSARQPAHRWPDEILRLRAEPAHRRG